MENDGKEGDQNRLIERIKEIYQEVKNMVRVGEEKT